LVKESLAFIRSVILKLKEIKMEKRYTDTKSENPYRFGVLVSNHVEDRFGKDLLCKIVI
jgi:hypothetical protein